MKNTINYERYQDYKSRTTALTEARRKPENIIEVKSFCTEARRIGSTQTEIRESMLTKSLKAFQIVSCQRKQLLSSIDNRDQVVTYMTLGRSVKQVLRHDGTF
jgi:hypothetical protein